MAMMSGHSRNLGTCKSFSEMGVVLGIDFGLKRWRNNM